MYSNEIKELLQIRDGLITREDYSKAFNPNISTQINWIYYNKNEDAFSVATKDGYYFHFQIAKEEAVEQKPAVKVKKV